MYDQIQSENMKEIVEGIISRLQGELEECRRINEENKSKSDDVKRKIESALEDVYMLAETLCEHVVNKKRNHFQNLVTGLVQKFALRYYEWTTIKILIATIDGMGNIQPLIIWGHSKKS